MSAKSGQCLCGAVKFTASPKKNEMGVCHCGMCRRWTGGTFMAVSCGAEVKVEDDSQLGVYTSSDWGGALLLQEMRLNPFLAHAGRFEHRRSRAGIR